MNKDMYPRGRDQHLSPAVVDQFKTLLLNWKEAAVKDGWVISPMYEGHENVERAAKLSKEGGWVAHVIVREDYLSISVWTDGGMSAIGEVTFPYSMESLQEQTKICHFCRKPASSLHHVGFANVSCPSCLAKARKNLEYPGWCD